MNALSTRIGQMAVGVILARLIVPEQFGVFAVALVSFNILSNASEIGVSVALVRWPDEPEQIAPTVTSIALGASTLLATVAVVTAGPIAEALHVPEAASVIRVLALAIIVAGATATPVALLQRDFRQDHRMIADVTNLVVSAAVAVVLAVMGFGAMSLAWSRVAGNGASAVVLFRVSDRIYRPGFDRQVAQELLRFGLPLTGASLLVFATLNVDYVVVGREMGALALGYYLLAFNLSSLPVSLLSGPVRHVSLPGFARLLDDPQRLSESFARSLGLLLTAAIPICVLLSSLATPAIRLVYGPRWVPAAEALVFLAWLGAFRAAFEMGYDVLVAIGRTSWTLVTQLIWVVALSIALVVGIRIGGIRGAAGAHVVVSAAAVAPAYLFGLARSSISTRIVLRHVRRPILGGIAAWLAAWLVAQTSGQGIAAVSAGATLAALVYVSIVAPGLRDRMRFEPDRLTSPAVAPAEVGAGL